MRGRQAGRHYSRKLYFSTSDRILLHLLEFVGREGELSQPDDMTQFGIADSIGLGRTTVSKAIRRLEGLQLVKSQRAHVPSGRLRRTVYLLTDQGVLKANHRKWEIEEKVVMYRDDGAAPRRLKVAQLPSILPEYATLLDVVTHIRQGVFDSSTFRGRGKRLVDMTDRAPRPRYFFGRVHELAEMDAWLERRESKVLAITGPPGIGKTTLLARKLEDWRGRYHLVFQRIMPWTTIRSIAHQLAEFLTRIGRKELAQYLQARASPDIEQMVEILAEDLHAVPLILTLDDYQAAEATVRDFLHALRVALENVEGAKLVVAGRHIPRLYDRKDVRVGTLVTEMELGGLDPASAKEILDVRNLSLPPGGLELILRQTGGHPLFLELIIGGSSSGTEDISRYLNEEILSRLTDGEAKVMMSASVFRRPVPGDALATGDELNLVRGLADRAFLREVSPRFYEVHDIIRAFFADLATPKERRRYHRHAAQHYLSSPSADRLEALYHFVEAGETTAASRLAIREGKNLLKRETEEFLHLLERLQPTVVDPAQSAELRLLRARAMDIRGNPEAAAAIYREVLERISAEDPPGRVAEAHHQLGDISRRRGQGDLAERHLEEARKFYETAENARGQAEVLQSLGQLAEDRGDASRASRLYGRSNALAHRLGMRALEAELELAAARRYMIRGEYEAALERKARALEIGEYTGDWHLLAKLHISVGVAYFRLERYADAVESYEQGIAIARKIGNLRWLAFGLYNAAGLLSRKGDFARGEAFLKESASLFHRLGDPLMQALVLQYEGALWSRRGKWGLAKQKFSESVERLRKLSSPYDLVSTLYAFSFHCFQNGEDESGLRCLDEAEQVARRSGLEAMLRELSEYRRRQTLGEAPRGRETPGPDAAPAG